MDKVLSELISVVGEDNVVTDEFMSNHTSFKIGGPADYFVTPNSTKKLCEVVAYCRRKNIDYYIVGNGTNLLVSDKGFRGVVIQIQKKLCDICIKADEIYAEAGALLSKTAGEAAKSSLTGLEFAAGIPGTIGGAVVMNAGAYGGEICDVLIYADVFQPGYGIKRLERHELDFGYRTSIFKKKDWIVLGASLKLGVGDKDGIYEKMAGFKAERSEKQPLDMPSAGSAFKRPEGHFAAKLIMEAGLKGYSVGDAEVSKKHCGFFVNKGRATAKDMRSLFDKVQKTVYERTGIKLEPEVRFLGDFSDT